ncbi:hypothetical protein DPMN_004610 [Dreissena polymorpha]|uniref:Uncharacterized protein n=1 Tax=Dreissena polymorpha TaxID=45954 RepID=A0A9D4MQI8_DREPO|nr:hypothetical protein DPMN_004610 [Dreissena polymorpha]
MLGSENELIITTVEAGPGVGEDADMHEAVMKTLSLVVERPLATRLLRLPLTACGW